ncbi:MAG TPA: T9SS type A sorting domain-containing protein, partial [Chitinophagaceae bacterium]|nr:T9SS type A sorting domain-containing protein [Chitinophagaceae bacterium]
HKVIDGGLNIYNQGGAGKEDCSKTYREIFGEKNIQVGLPRDPNEIYGPEGYGPQRYITTQGKVGYTVSYENVASASASAQRVYVLDTLDKTKFDLSDFELATFTISDSVYFIPPSLKEYTQSVKIKQFNNVDVLANIKLDTATGILSCTYLSIDPVTRELIDTASLLGFLPPNTSPPRGQGSISYSVKIKNSLPSGTTVPNRAGIVFDKNNSIITNTWINTIDKTSPVISGLITTLVNDTTVRLNFNSSDQHSGVNGHKVFMSVNSGTFTQICYAGKDSLIFIGMPDSSYTFYAIPIDNVGNMGTVSEQVTVKLPPEQMKNGNLRVFPNPGRNVFHIRLKVPETQKITVILYNISGQLVKNIFSNNASGVLTISTDLSNLNSGVYIVQVIGDKGLKMADKLVIISW